MIRIRLIGGLGNQLFQFAIGRAIAEDLGKNLIIDTSDFKTYKLWRPLILNFPLSDRVLTQDQRGKSRLLNAKDRLLGRYFKEKNLKFNRRYNEINHSATLRGYFQSEKYFVRHANVIRAELRFVSARANELRRSWGDKPVAALHFRRGDYLNETAYGLCKVGYYRAGMAILRAAVPDVRFVAFTDDPEWFQAESGLANEVSLASEKSLSDLDEFALMSSCDHFIIANSSFSWWAAWLGRASGKKVIAPKPWFDSDQNDGSTVVPGNWMELPKSIEGNFLDS